MSNARKSLAAKNQAGPSRADDTGPEQNLNLEDANVSEDEEGGTRIGGIYIPPPVQPYCSMESKGSRLVIRYIENVDFKSYAGKVVLGPFHQSFTSIIGPNGSGKSNVIDSMLFVFGYRAQKIRCKKLSVMLHKSAKFPNVQRCSVAVHFVEVIDLPNGECKDVEGSELAIARTAFKDSSSYYTINGKKVHFKEVSKLLKSYNVDLDHNRFLILQGEVESISMMKPKGTTENEVGMLEYLEDIVGTTRYKEPLQKINARVEMLTEERSEKHNRCKLAEREMKDLEQPFNEAVEYLQLENKQMRTKNLYVQKSVSELKQNLKEVSEEQEKVVTELKEHDEQFDGIKKERTEKEKLIKEEIEKYDKLVKNKEEMEAEHKSANNRFVEIQSTMEATNKRRKQNKKQLDTLKTKLIDLEKLPEKNEAEIAECEKKIEQHTKTKTKLEEELQENYVLLESETRPLIEKREVLENNLMELKKNVDEAKGNVALAESELKILKHDETQEKRKFECLRSSYEESKTNLNEMKAKFKDIQFEVPGMKQEISEKTKKLGELKNEELTIRNKLMSIKSEISEKTNSMQMSRSNNKVLDSLMRAKQEGKIPGILGRLGDLGGIDAKYDVAISTACGRLDNIVVDTVNSAQACIEHLKRYDLGRASFIALEKIAHYARQANQSIQTPENAPRLFDLVRVEDERIRPAFYFALRNTLVANDLDHGTRIAYSGQRFRVVTLSGDVIETSGTMSGGGRSQIRGKMGQKVATKTKESANVSINEKALEEMQVQAEDLQSRINYCQEEQGRIEKELHLLHSNLQIKEGELNRLNINISSLAEQLPRIEAQLKTQKERAEKTTSDAAKVSQLEEDIAEKREVFEKSEEEAKKVSTKIEEINKRIADIHGDKVKAVQTKITNVTKQINTLTNNVSKLKVEVTTSERNFKKVEKQIEELTADIKSAEEEIIQLSEKRASGAEELEEWLIKIAAAKEEIAKANRGSSDIQKEVIALQKQESDLKLKRVEIEQNLQTLNEQISEINKKIPAWLSKLKPLQLQEIPGDSEPLEPLKEYTEEELAQHKLQDIQYLLASQDEKLKANKPNLSCIQEYTTKREVYLERVKVLEDITTKRNEMRQLYDDVRKKRHSEFNAGYAIIVKKLKEMYQMITQGGAADLELVDSMDPFTEGICFSVRPPRKSWKNIANLSGGEKTLSSLALVFALHYYKPSPLYFMDEIDAALDFKNISIVAYYIKERTKNAQFIIISLRSNMFELSNSICGIYKVFDCTSSVTMKNIVPGSGKHNQTLENIDVDPTENNAEESQLEEDHTLSSAVNHTLQQTMPQEVS